jgi:hypothetical protein
MNMTTLWDKPLFNNFVSGADTEGTYDWTKLNRPFSGLNLISSPYYQTGDELGK